MKKIILLFLAILPFCAFAQQLPDVAQMSATNFMWNPAMTAPMEYWEAAAFHRQQWSGFEDAPRTTGVSYQHPLLDKNMSLGVFIQHDQVHPLHSNAISFTYAYKLRFAREHQLSIGALGSISEYHINVDDIVTFDDNDLLLLGDETTKMIPNAGFGLYYQSYAGSDFEKTYYYAGIGSNQLFGSNLLFQNSEIPANFKRALHGNAHFGARFIKDKLAIEPSVWLNYAHTGVLTSNFKLQAEYYEGGWAGLSFASSGIAAFQAGVILKGGLLKDGLMRIGMMASYNMGTLGAYQGLGYEFYVAYRFDQE